MNAVLLTGAGFTKTFGGYLASEMWAAILNQPEVQKSPDLLKGMRGNLNYEKFYDNIQTLGKDHEKKDLSDAVRRAFGEMEEILREIEGPAFQVAYGCCKTFISRFTEAQRPAFIFTLNQDMYFERFHRYDLLTVIPGLRQHPRWFKMQAQGSWETDYSLRLPTTDELKPRKAELTGKSAPHLAYIKLHGSYGWTSHDGSDVMVMGTDKASLIEKEPLLKWYFSLFEKALNTPDTRLVTIGYGFGDMHINRRIVEARVSLYIISPQPPADFKNDLESKPLGLEVWNRIVQYWPAKVTDFYFPSRSKPSDLTHKGKVLFKSLGLL